MRLSVKVIFIFSCGLAVFGRIVFAQSQRFATQQQRRTMTPAAAASSTTATPVTGSNGSRAVSINTASVAASSASTDPNALLDSLDAYTSARATAATAAAKLSHSAPHSSSSSTSLDPVDFLNRHYTTESMLVSQLPALRNAVSERMERLDERISTALQRQSETADMTRRHVQDAKSSVASLEKRIRLVQSKASQSEQAVLEITKDMKRLDCAKRHLQRTITTLKRLHMLVNAVEQLRLSALTKPFPDYKTASHLVDATRLLLKHFDSYTQKVEPMRLLGLKVRGIQLELRKGLVRGFRISSFGLTKALELEQGVKAKPKVAPSTPTAETPRSSFLPTPELTSFNLEDEDEEEEEDDDEDESLPTMTPEVLADGTLLLDALGMDSRTDFVRGVCQDHLTPYRTLFAPAPPPAANPNSFKISSSSNLTENKPPYSLDQIDRRFAWYRRTLKELGEKFPHVFPPYWNFQYAVTRQFLELTKEHLLALLDGPLKDRDSENATILLKALQKTILFEKEMTAWLQREYGTVFLVKSEEGGKPAASSAPVRGDDGEILEFDKSGKAVAANSSEGIRIKYERQKKERGEAGAEKIAAAALDEGRALAEQVPVEHLIGVASSAYDNYMSPYIALEEQSMNEQLVEALNDRAVDTRGELPVYTSSTALFVYIKGSITRCTALTKGRALFLLYQAFSDSLQKYASVLSGKLPSPFTGTSLVGGLNLAASTFGKQEGSTSVTSASYKIPPGGEVTACHVVSTCEYCVDTVEALEDLIRDTIDDNFKDKVEMTSEQEAFHDVIAKSIRVLVSGLENRLEGAMRAMSALNWSIVDVVDEESSYVRSIHEEIEPFATTARGLLPSSYFRSFCDKFALTFTNMYYQAIIRLKRISEPGTQQLLLDVYNIKTLLLKLPVIEKAAGGGAPKKSGSAGSKIAPAMYTKMVTKQFKRIECLLKLVGTPTELLIDVFKVQWPGGSALDLQLVTTLKGMKRTEQAAILEKFGVDPAIALRASTAGVSGASIVKERFEGLQDRSSDVAAKVNSNLSQMRQKGLDFRTSFR